MIDFFWSIGNRKLIKTAKAWKKRFRKPARFVSFNIPQLHSEDGGLTCPYAGACARVCYASQGMMRFPTSKNTREHNWRLIKAMTYAEFSESAVDDLSQMKSVTHVRIHDSGDFFSRSYYESWVDVARSLPGMVFYAYTKSIPFIDWSSHPDNFRLVQSFGGKRDKDIDTNRPHSRIFATEADRRRARYCDGNVSDLPAVLGQKKIGLVYHGNRKLTKEDVKRLDVV